MTRNVWQIPLVAAAYSYQQKAKPYLELVKTTESFIKPIAGERWLDIGCGSGRLIRCIWDKSHGSVLRIVGVDISYTALMYAKKSISKFTTRPAPDCVQLIQADFSKGLGKLFHPSSFDGVTAGLSLSYADYWDTTSQNWSNRSYLELLRDIHIVLKKGGSFIFSSNVPNPDFLRIALRSWREIFLTWKAPLHFGVSLIMLFQSRWLKNSARKGRFHYLAAGEIIRSLESVGFKVTQHRLTYESQAWVFLAIK